MTQALSWISTNLSSFATLVSAIIAASVALGVFSLTQYLEHRRNRVQFLSPKLEELYLLINKVGPETIRVFKIIHLHLTNNSGQLPRLEKVDEPELYGHITGKEIVMFIRLYFPKLSHIHQILFSAQRELNRHLYSLQTSSPSTLEEVHQTSGRVGYLLRLMEAEMIDNRDYLIGDYLFLKNYISTPQSEIDAELDLPDPF
jgi:hypothetical protein